MKKITSYSACYVLSLYFLICFLGNVVRDFVAYKTTLNSAPFSLWILVDCIYFVLPAGLLYMLAVHLRKKTAPDHQ